MRQVREHTDRYVIIDQMPLGTTCARTGCMPSKAFIHLAKAYHRCRGLSKAGIGGVDSLKVDISDVLAHVRSLRDHFTEIMIQTTRNLAGEHLIEGKARLISPKQIRVNDFDIQAEKIIIATGAHPKMPDAWKALEPRVMTSETIFEQSDIPRRIAVIGLGPIGLEIGQA